MSTAAFGGGVLATALAGVVAVLSSRVSERLRIPAPAFFLIAAAAAADLWPRLGGLSFTAVDQVVSVALAVILFDGGMRVGWRRMKSVAGPTLWIGVAGTLVTAGGVAVLAHLILALDWRVALLLGAALAPTDPAVMFSVLGRREVAGRGGALLEGESGSNDPVSIALLAALVRSLQYLLNAHGAKLTVDGVFGPKTKAAVAAFQHAKGLTASGVVQAVTWRALVVTVHRGSAGPAVRAVQDQINFRNLKDGRTPTVDGLFGPKTETSVRAFQRAMAAEVAGFRVDGIVGAQTWQALVSEALSG